MRSGRQVGRLATYPPLPGGVPTTSKRGAESEVAHKWARWLHNPCLLGVPTASKRGARWPHNSCCLRGPHRFKAGGRMKSGPQVSKVATYPLPPGGSPPLQSGEENQKHKWARWLHDPCRLRVPTASKRGAESKVAHKWARWLHNPCCLGGAHRFKAGGKIRGDPQVGKVAT